jgi:hypothetical protein
MFDIDENGNSCRANPCGESLLKKIKEVLPALKVVMFSSKAFQKEDFPLADKIVKKLPFTLEESFEDLKIWFGGGGGR